MSADEKSKYNPVVDLLRILAILAVILIHTTTKVLEFFKYDFSPHQLTLFLNQAPRFAVPLFFLISAFVLELNYPQPFNYFSYLKKRFSRLFLPYVFWSAIYYFFVYTPNTQNFIFTLFSGGASYQLYFIPALFIFYLIFPLFHHFANFFSHRTTLFFLILLQIIILSFDYYHRSLPFPYPISVFILNLGPFIIGILASRYQKNILNFVQKYQKYFLIVSLIFPFLIFYEGENFYLKTQNYLSFYSQWRPSIFIYTLVISAYLYFIFSQIKLSSSLVKKIADIYNWKITVESQKNYTFFLNFLIFFKK